MNRIQNTVPTMACCSSNIFRSLRIGNYLRVLFPLAQKNYSSRAEATAEVEIEGGRTSEERLRLDAARFPQPRVLSAKEALERIRSGQQQGSIVGPSTSTLKRGFEAVDPRVFDHPPKTVKVGGKDVRLLDALDAGVIDDSRNSQVEFHPRNFSKLLSLYARLSKARLTGMVVLSGLSGCFMCPVPIELSSLVFCTIGTAAMAASANAINQWYEVPNDSRMKRTQSRPLVVLKLSPSHAINFACVTSMLGMASLYLGANSMAACLGAANLFLYVAAYTPMKKTSIANTWVGSIVGAIPPLMGWAAASGGVLDPAAFVLAGVLYAWQFPHFNALSWNLRSDYERVGYKMMCVENPDLCVNTTVRYAGILTLLCSFLAPVSELTTWTFAATSLPVNGYLMYLSYRFYSDRDSRSSRSLFRYTLFYLPAISLLMVLSKK